MDGYNKLGLVHCTYLRVSGYYIIFEKYFLLSKELFFTFTNSVDPDEMPHYGAFHLGLHCLKKYPNTKGLPLSC